VKKSSIFDSLKGRKIRFGGYTTLLILAVLAVVIVVNVLVGQIPGKLDLTQNRLYSLSDETNKLLNGLKSDVTITTVSRAGSEDPTIKEILAKYAARSRHIKLQTIDPDRNPGWTRQYDTSGQGISPGSLVVAEGTKFRTIGPYDLYNYDTSNPNQQPRLTSLSVEQRVTSALLFVASDRNVTLYILQGHGEQTLDTLGLSTAVSNENYAVKDFSLLSASAVPADADILLILAPKSDLSAQDAEKVRAYLARGGRAVIMLNVITRDAPMPNIETLLQSYGVQVQNVVVVEGDQNKIAAQNPLYVIPGQEYHDILAPLRANNYDIVMPGAQVIQTLDLRKKSLKIEPLLTSSAKSWGKRDIADAKTIARQSGDLPGPFTLAVAITDAAAEPSGKETKLIVAGDIQFLSQALTSQVPGNGDFFMNSLGWLRGQKQTLTVRPKSLLQMRLSLSNLEALLFSGLVVILLPLLVLGTGFTVWARRRHL
jgi:ABC-2 type transport system permease protein